MSRDRRVGTYIDRARQELPDAWAGLHPEDREFLAECEGLRECLETGVPLSELEDYREVFIELTKGFVLPARRGPSVGPRGTFELARRCLLGLVQIGRQDYRNETGRERVGPERNERLWQRAIELVEQKWPEVRRRFEVPRGARSVGELRDYKPPIEETIELAHLHFDRSAELMRPAWQSAPRRRTSPRS
jgi:hypothetical protein